MSRKILPPAEAIAETNPKPAIIDPIPEVVGEKVEPGGVIPPPQVTEVRSTTIRIPEGAEPLPSNGVPNQVGKRYRATGPGTHYFPAGKSFTVASPVFTATNKEDIELLDWAASLNPTSIFILE